MRTHNQSQAAVAAFCLKQGPSAATLLCVAALLSWLTGCKKSESFEAIDTDANGYLCLKCGAKYYTDRTVFMGPKCPKCNEEKLTQVVGYYCEKDKHMTIQAGQGERKGGVCERCQAPLVNAMRMPREKDLKEWGATKSAS
jgi:transcription initiation factor IIE alpha subunit